METQEICRHEVFYRPLMLFLICFGFGGCFAHYQQSKIGTPIAPETVAQIQRGRATFREVLSWLGPPDFIIDGAQQIPNAESIVAAYSGIWNIGAWMKPITPRLLTAPAGTVILIYRNVDASNVAAIAAIIGRGGREVREGELFVFVSKETLTVTDLAVGNSP